jgi:hypothetical protein
MEGNSEILSEARSLVAGAGETEPCLLDLLEPIPGIDKVRRQGHVSSLFPQEDQVVDDLLVEGAIRPPPAVE